MSASQRRGWLSDSPPQIPPSTRSLLETYSHIPPDEVAAHCVTVRDRAFAIHPYPCVGQWRFLHLFIGQHPLYRSVILPRLRDEGQSYLDLGCCFAQDVRRLVADGVESSMCWASDLRLDFVEAGFDLFRDRDTLRATFLQADVLDESAGNPLEALRGRFDIIGASSLLHLFAWEDQKKVAHRIVRLLRPRDGGLVVGRQMARTVAGEHRVDETRSLYRHNAESWKRLWEEVSGELDGEVQFEIDVKIEATASPPRVDGSDSEERLMMIFTVRARWLDGSEPS